MITVNESSLFKCKTCGTVSTDFNSCDCIDLIIKAYEEFKVGCTCIRTILDWIALWMHQTSHLPIYSNLGLRNTFSLDYDHWNYVNNGVPERILQTTVWIEETLPFLDTSPTDVLRHSYLNGKAVEFIMHKAIMDPRHDFEERISWLTRYPRDYSSYIVVCPDCLGGEVL